MNTKKVIKALERWSPNGLCSGLLVERNGVQAKTEACAVGCLALEFLHSKPGKNFVRTRGGLKKYVRRALYQEEVCNEELTAAIEKHYGLQGIDDGSSDLDRMMYFNDHVGVEKDAAQIAAAAAHSQLPKTLTKTIVRLRKQFDNWEAKQNPDERYGD